MSQSTYLIFGSSGTVGAQIAKNLIQKGLNVRLATSRKPTQANQVQVNLVTGEGVHQAFEGVDRVFLLSPPGYANQQALLSPLVQESKRRGVKKVVLMTAFGANASEEAPFRKVEVELEKSGLAYNIIRPNWFLQNFNTFWIKNIIEKQQILLPAGQAKTSFIDARDISDVATKLLSDDSFNNQDFDLTGPEALTHEQVAQAISVAIDKKITYVDVPEDHLRQELLGAGLPKDYTEFLLMIMSYLKLGYSSAITQNVEKILGRKPRSIVDYTRDYKNNLK